MTRSTGPFKGSPDSQNPTSMSAPEMGPQPFECCERLSARAEKLNATGFVKTMNPGTNSMLMNLKTSTSSSMPRRPQISQFIGSTRMEKPGILDSLRLGGGGGGGSY